MENLAPGFSFDLPKGNSSIIKVIGVGGGGNNALRYMYEKGIHGVDFIICNTDSQTLDNNPVSNKVQLGVSITEGLGAGADPEVGEKAAIESMDDIKSILGQNTKMVFITAGMGGGTGTGAAPVIAKIAKEMGILTIAIVTVPFSFEGKRRLDQAEIGLEKLRDNVDSLIVINNDKLRQQFGNLGFKQGFAKADEVLTNAAKGMAEVITGYFDVNIDFRDAKSVLQNSGTALMSTGTASGPNKAEEAVRKALDSPLLNDNKITGARNVLLLIRSGADEATMDEIGIINDHIQKEAGNTADIIFGVGSDQDLGEEISVLVIATGFAKENKKHSGITEKVKYSLNDLPEKKETPFVEPEINENITNQTNQDGSFGLQNNKPNFSTFSTLTPEKENISTETTDFKIVDKEIDEVKEEKTNLFNFDTDAFTEEDLEPQGFKFETEDQKRTTENLSFSEEKPIEFNFYVNNNPQKAMPKEEILPEAMAEKKLEGAIEIKLDLDSDDTQTFENGLDSEEEGIKFINKETNQKIKERRNKLKEFNSRFQFYEDNDDFETTPAFKRRNISIEGENPSDQNINSFLSEDEEGQIKIKENRFLNKDVD